MSDHDFGDERRSRQCLVAQYQMLTQISDPLRFAETVLDVLRPYEREKPLRRWLRGPIFPNGRDGFVLEDLDLGQRRFGPAYGTDRVGELRLIETKWDPSEDPRPIRLRDAQLRTFGLLDKMCKQSDLRDRYYGFHLVTHSSPNVIDGRVWVGQPFDGNAPVEYSQDDFTDWFAFARPGNGLRDGDTAA